MVRKRTDLGVPRGAGEVVFTDNLHSHLHGSQGAVPGGTSGDHLREGHGPQAQEQMKNLDDPVLVTWQWPSLQAAEGGHGQPPQQGQHPAARETRADRTPAQPSARGRQSRELPGPGHPLQERSYAEICSMVGSVTSPCQYSLITRTNS